MRRTRHLLAGALPLLLLGCPKSREAAPSAGSSAPAVDQPAVVDVVPVVAKKLTASVHLEGELAPYEAVELHARASGFVQRVQVDRGSKVKAGELLVVISATWSSCSK